MRLRIFGECATANAVRTSLMQAGFRVAPKLGLHSTGYTLHIQEYGGAYIHVDGVDCELERNMVNCIANLTETPILLQRAGGVQSDREIRIRVTKNDDDQKAVELGVLRGMLRTAKMEKPERVKLPAASSVGLAIAILAILMLFTISLKAQQLSNTVTRIFAGVPTNSCTTFQLAKNTANQHFYSCDPGTLTWVDIGPSSGSGSQHQVNGVNLTANDPVNFVDGDITFSNPSAGNITASCPTCLTSFPRLDQVGTPAVDKTFDMGTHKLGFEWSSNPAEIFIFGRPKSSLNALSQTLVGLSTNSFTSLDVSTSNGFLFLNEKNVAATSNGRYGTTIIQTGANGTALDVQSYNTTDDNAPLLTGIEIFAGQNGAGTGGHVIELFLNGGYVNAGGQVTGIKVGDQSYSDNLNSARGMVFDDMSGVNVENIAVDIGDVSGATENDGIRIGVSSSPGSWAINAIGTAASHFGGVTDAPVFNATIGFQGNGLAPLGNGLRGDGTNFVSAQFSCADLSDEGTGCAGAAYPGLVAHDILSVSHGDTTPSAAVRGGAIFAVGASPTWTQVAHSATTGGYWKWNGTDAVASTLAAGGTGSCTNQFETADNADAAPTCTTATLASAQFANQGTTTTLLHGNAAGNPSFGAVVEADITLADNTTNDVSTTKHGFVPKGTNVGKFLRDDGSWQTVSASLPSGLIVFIASGTCPAGFTEVAGLSGKFVLGTTAAGGDVGTTGGSSSYTPAGTNASSAVSGIVVDAHASHTHTYTDVITHTHAENGPSSASGGALTLGIDTNASGNQATGSSTAAPASSVATGTTAGPSASLTHNVSNNGTAAAQAFTGTPATITPPYIKLIGCSSN